MAPGENIYANLKYRVWGVEVWGYEVLVLPFGAFQSRRCLFPLLSFLLKTLLLEGASCQKGDSGAMFWKPEFAIREDFQF